jgi:hypothetical protein
LVCLKSFFECFAERGGAAVWGKIPVTTDERREGRMGEWRQVAGDWVGRRVEVFLEGDEHPRVGVLEGLEEEGIELAEEEYPDPYGEGTVQQGSPTFYRYDSVAEVRPAEDRGAR